MATAQDLYDAYESFCSFGSTRNLATGSTDSMNGLTMDGPKFAKFAKDTKIVGKGVTTTDVDLIFNRAKAKGSRRLDWDSFQIAFKLLAEKKIPIKERKRSI